MYLPVLESISSHLGCPRCHGPLSPVRPEPDGVGGSLHCPACAELYPIRGHVPVLLPERELTACCRQARRPLAGIGAWLRHLQAHTLARVLSAPGASDGPHQDPRHIELVRRYLQFRSGRPPGLVLDVGAGGAARRSQFSQLTYVALDPVIPADGAAGAGVMRLQAAAEYVPLRSRVADRVLATEVMPYLLDPARALAEMVRVLRPGGHLFLFAPAEVPAAARLASHLPPDWYRQQLAHVFHRLEIMEDSGFHYIWGWDRRTQTSRGMSGDQTEGALCS